MISRLSAAFFFCFFASFFWAREPSRLPWLKPDRQGDLLITVSEIPPFPLSLENTENTSSPLVHLGILCEVHGHYARRQAKITGPRQEFAALPEGDYDLVLKTLDGQLLASRRVEVIKRKKLEVEFVLLGPSQVKPGEWNFETHIRGGRVEGGTRILRDGAVEWRMDDGSRRYSYRGQTWIEKPDQEKLWILDHDDDRIEDSQDPDFRGSLPSSRDLLLGKIQFPVLKELQLEPIWGDFQKDTGRGIRVLAHLSEAGGSRVTSVQASLYQSGRIALKMELLDDGSLLDVHPRLPLNQISSDTRAQDGIYTALIPVDAGLLEILYSCTLRVEAFNQAGHPSNVLLQEIAIPRLSKDEGKEGLDWEKILLKARFTPQINEDGGLVLHLQMNLPEDAEVMLHTKTRSVLLFGEKNGLKEWEFSDTLAVPSGGSGFLTVRSASGNLFYAGYKAP